jgi:hypothetical protein
LKKQQLNAKKYSVSEEDTNVEVYSWSAADEGTGGAAYSVNMPVGFLCRLGQLCAENLIEHMTASSESSDFPRLETDGKTCPAFPGTSGYNECNCPTHDEKV